MSAFTEATTVIKDKSALVKALQQMGWSKNVIEVHDKPVSLNGYHREEKRQAHIVIRKNNLRGGGAYNDLGFLQQADGTFQVIGENAGPYGRITGNKFLDTLTSEYAFAKVNDELETAGYFVDTVERRNGKIYVTAENPYE